MGDPKKHRKKYETPSHPWRGERIKEESGLVKEFGLKNKKEVWKASSFLRKFKKQTKMLITESGAQAEKEKKLMLEKLARLGLATSDIHLEDVLGLGTKDILERRLQTQVVRKNLANSMKQSRQFIVHGHVSIKGHKVTIPSNMVLRE
ncbi:MAG: 30S ribosomal protein S4 [Candidatus Diapherotrites archaeon]|nr:30S ribosomal protein S4 [Candidatus Diapherotrites archaeon]